MSPRSRRRDAGQATMLLLAVVATGALAVVGAAAAGRTLVRQGNARAAADAGALAAAVRGCAGARDVVEANGATLLSCADDGVGVVLWVRVGDVEASARAIRSP